MKKIVWMFSGQGSQYFNMGRDLYEADAVFREELARCDEAYGAARGSSLLNVIYPATKVGSDAVFDELRHTHPALFCLQYSLARTLLRRNHKPDLLLGYSLGEIVAAAVAGAMPFEAFLQVVMRQAEVLPSAAGPGGMLAVLAAPDSAGLDDPAFTGTAVAARNFANHFVLSGALADIERAQLQLKAREISTLRLPVPVAFHSPRLEVAKRAVKELVRDFQMRELSIPLMSASRVGLLEHLTPDFFWDVVREPVRFADAVAWLEARGDYAYVDLGPSGTLATFLKYVLPRSSGSSYHTTLSPYNRAVENLRNLEKIGAAV